LIIHDRVQADQFEITQVFLAQMLGAHRQNVTVAVSNLQKAGLIRYSRGKLAILDRRGLEAASCGCYQAVTREFEKLYA
jgi:Mn-dependent DtxR family transcriptional regulator